MVEAEVVYCCRHEYCTRVEDFVARRCRIAFLDVEAARSCLPKVGRLEVAVWEVEASKRGMGCEEISCKARMWDRLNATFLFLICVLL